MSSSSSSAPPQAQRAAPTKSGQVFSDDDRDTYLSVHSHAPTIRDTMGRMVPGGVFLTDRQTSLWTTGRLDICLCQSTHRTSTCAGTVNRGSSDMTPDGESHLATHDKRIV